MSDFKTQTKEKTNLERLIDDVNSHGILFNFKDGDKLKTGIIRKGEYHEGIFKNGMIPATWRKMTRKERRSLR